MLTSADGFTTPIGELVFEENEFGINLGPEFVSGEYGVGNAWTLSRLLETPEWFERGELEIRGSRLKAVPT